MAAAVRPRGPVANSTAISHSVKFQCGPAARLSVCWPAGIGCRWHSSARSERRQTVSCRSTAASGGLLGESHDWLALCVDFVLLGLTCLTDSCAPR